MRVIAGTYRSRILKSLKGLALRPTSDRLDDFQADFAFLPGTCFTDPDHPAPLGVGQVFIKDKFELLAALKIETSAQPETLSRRIEDQTWDSLRVTVQIDDQAGAPLRNHAHRAAAFRDWKAGHSSTPALSLS